MKKDGVDLSFPFDSTSWVYKVKIICPYEKLFYFSTLEK